MSKLIILSQLLAKLTHQRQEIVTGEVGLQLSGNYQFHKIPCLQQTSTLDGNGIINNSMVDTAVKTANQDLLPLGVVNIPNFVTLFLLT